MDDPAELELVYKAFQLARSGGIKLYVTGYVEWDADAATVARGKLAELDGLTPEAVRIMAIDFVDGGGVIKQSPETRLEWSEFRFKYDVKLNVPGFPSGVYVELRLIDSDPDAPVVQVVSAHKRGV